MGKRFLSAVGGGAIYLHHKGSLAAVEIANIWPDGMLTTKSDTQLVLPQHLP